MYRVAREGDGKSGDARRGGDAPGALPGPGGRAAGSHCPRIGVRVAAATAPAAPAGPQCEWVMSRVRRRPVWAAWAKAAAGRGGGSRGLGAGAPGISPPLPIPQRPAPLPRVGRECCRIPAGLPAASPSAVPGRSRSAPAGRGGRVLRSVLASSPLFEWRCLCFHPQFICRHFRKVLSCRNEGLFTALQQGLQSLPMLTNLPHSASKFPTAFSSKIPTLQNTRLY